MPDPTHYTPRDLARAIVDRLQIRRGQIVVDPHVGGGDFLHAVLDYARDRLGGEDAVRVEGGDMNADAPAFADERLRARARLYPGVDFLAPVLPYRDPDWIVGNPPHGDSVVGDLARPHIERALRAVRPGGSVVFLLPSQWGASVDRYEKLWAKPELRPYLDLQLVGRPRFGGYSGGNRYDYSVYWWNTAVPPGGPVLRDWFRWKTPRKKTPRKRRTTP